MDELSSLLGVSPPFLLLLLSIVIYFQNRSNRDEPTEDPAVKEPLRWNEMEDLRGTYTAMPLDRLVHLYCEYGLKNEARNLIVQELRNWGWVEQTLEKGKTVLVGPASQEVQFGGDWIN